MRVNLRVPYKQKEAAKKLGAKWDPGRQTWYVENIENLSPFLQWMPSHLTKAHEEKSAPIQETRENWWNK